MTTQDAILWVGFGLFLVTMLSLDLGVFHRRPHAIGLREAATWTAVWVALALAFAAALYFWRGPGSSVRFLTGYLIEEALSVDNMFVFLVIFSSFGVKREHQHRVLFWGIVGALVMRGGFIAAGVTLLHRFHWIIYVFGGFLVLTGLRMALQGEVEIHPESNPVLKVARRLLPVSRDFDGPRFLTRSNGRRLVTPLLLVLLIVESTDLVFALDSIPAVLAVTTDPFIVYTSNVFAILGLRSLYFLLAGVVDLFRYLKLGLAVVLTFVGAKMLLADVYEIPVLASLFVVLGVLAVSILASVLIPRGRVRGRAKAASPRKRTGPQPDPAGPGSGNA